MIASKNDLLDKAKSTLLSIDQVLEIIPVSKSLWKLGVKTGKFPQPVYISSRRIAWKSTDIANYIEQL